MFWIRTALLGISLSFFSLLLLAAEVSPRRAKSVATRFLQKLSQEARTEPMSLSLAYTKYSHSSGANARQSQQPLYYVFEVAKSGFIIVSADDTAYPILGFSEESAFDATSLPRAYVKWVAAYEDQLRDLLRQSTLPTVKVTKAWETLEQQSTTVGPLLTSTWNQSPHYNEACPYDAQANEHAVTGCVATALAQIMKYHQHPQKGIGFHSYIHSTYGTLSANFGLTEYAWDQMPDAISTSNPAVAQLNYHCGVSVDMDYSANESGAAGAVLVRPALRKYFQYEAEIAKRADYSTTEWVTILKEELDAGRPVYYEGSGTGGGHAFVCDGYQGDDFFHFNWGWGGFMNGFFFIGDISPSGQGTGGGTGSYNSNQKIVYQIQPAESPVAITYDLELNSETQINPNPVPFADPFEVVFSVANTGDVSFNGKFAVVVFDENNFQEVIDSIAVEDLPPQVTTTITLTTGGLPVVSPGSYQLAILYKEESQEWQLVESNNYPAYTDIEFLDSENDISLTTPVTLSAAPITQHEPLTVSFNVINTGSSVFSGILAAGLYSLDGKYQLTIGSVEVPSLSPNSTFAEDLIISSDGLNIEPGTYLLVMWSADTEKATILASGGFLHPRRIVIQVPPPVADSYEDNNTEAKAFTLIEDMTEDTMSVKTQGANQHTDVDYDYYQLVLPEGYDYEIDARVQDNFDTDDGQEYSNDVVLSYKLSGEWSEAFDAELDSAVTLKGGGTLTFLVAPYFAGQQGTYALDIQITRQEQLSLTLTTNDWDTLMIGSTEDIRWESNFSEAVTLALYQDDKHFSSIANSTSNDGAHQWAVPDSLEEMSKYQIIIYHANDTTIRSESTYFTIASEEASQADTTSSPEDPTIGEDDTITGISNDYPHQVLMYPNPVKKQLFIHFDNDPPKTIEFVNAQGAVLKKLDWHSEQTAVNLTELPSGLYLLRCRWKSGNTQIYPLLKE